MTNQKIIHQINALPFRQLTPQGLLNAYAVIYYRSLDFAMMAASARALFPKHKGLQSVISEEMATDNLRYDDFRGPAAHYEFLTHFWDKNNTSKKVKPEVIKACRVYQNQFFTYSPGQIAEIFAMREDSYASVCTEILEAIGWQNPNLSEYPELGALRYFLERHYELDSAEDGHANSLRDLAPATDGVPRYWKESYKLYKSLF